MNYPGQDTLRRLGGELDHHLPAQEDLDWMVKHLVAEPVNA